MREVLLSGVPGCNSLHQTPTCFVPARRSASSLLGRKSLPPLEPGALRPLSKSSTLATSTWSLQNRRRVAGAGRGALERPSLGSAEGFCYRTTRALGGEGMTGMSEALAAPGLWCRFSKF